MKYHEKLAMLRKLLQLTQEEMAASVCVALKTWQRYELGSVSPDHITHLRILNVFNINQLQFDRFDIQKIFDGLRENPEQETQMLKDKIDLKYVRFLEKRVEDLEQENTLLKFKQESSRLHPNMDGVVTKNR